MDDELEEVETEDVVDEVEDEVEEETLPSRTYRVQNDRIIAMTDGQSAMVQAVDKILRTERFVYPIYDDQYGNDLGELIGKDFDYAEVEVDRMLTEALEADDRVTDVSIDETERVDSTTLKVIGSCETIFGTIPIESEVTLSES
ncbi:MULTISPECIES: DUF2634 domain-containing protein [Lactobacillaceae]|uniref:DUF2634 domain-containing protein n=1 Tax=Lactobacillaceae TaxID=33958 RepID=UPI0014573A41|nr:DUF2634 domain-containing protein [Lactobacillus sp. HBUAS51381]NLR08658.1 DUF2634 domain-containing protein [Lactobacillus sp. HBUAS51381]